MEKIMCDCGHIESECSNITVGYGVMQDGKKICLKCCYEKEKEDLKNNDVFTGYISSDGKRFTTWHGDLLGYVYHWGKPHNFSKYRTGRFSDFRRYVTIKDIFGNYWYGTGSEGMYTNLRKKKVKS